MTKIYELWLLQRWFSILKSSCPVVIPMYDVLLSQEHVQGSNIIKETPIILTSIFKRVLNNQNLTYFNAFCLLFMSFDMFI